MATNKKITGISGLVAAIIIAINEVLQHFFGGFKP